MDDFSNSFLHLIFTFFLICILSLGLFLKKTSQAIDYWLFLGSLPSLTRNSNRLPEWLTEVFCTLGRGSFFIDGPIFPNLKYFRPDFKQIFDPLGDGIFNLDSDAWKAQRRTAHAAFISGKFKDLLSNISRRVVEDQVPMLVHVAKTGSTIDLQEVCSRFAFDVNMNAIFGMHTNYLSFGVAQEAVLCRHTVPMFSWKLMRFFKIGREGESILSWNGHNRSGLIWFFWLVSKTPSVEKKILEELKGLMSSKTGKLVFEYHEWPCVFYSGDINVLVYLHAALCESLRLYPAVSINSKTVLKEVVLPDGSLIKQGMQIIIPFYSNGSKFFTFNRGPRTCSGKDMSFTQMKAVVAAVLFNFEVQVLEGQHVRPKPAITLHMEKGLGVRIQKRVT
ncbi:hypothetical protein MKX01_019289 [Papaver californicum]|nr:hypothetical protein MKX01_019289 [Papaver californicum]